MYNCGQFVIDFLGFETGKIGPLHTVFRFSESTTVRDAAIFILNSINIMLLGALCGSTLTPRSRELSDRDESVTRKVGWLLLFVSAVPTALSLKEQLTIPNVRRLWCHMAERAGDGPW